MAKLHITTQHVKILPDQVVLDVKGEIPQQQISALHGCQVGYDHGPKVTVKMLPKPKHLDAEEVVAKVKECLQIQEHSKKLGGAIRHPDPNTRSNWQSHTRLVETSDDGDTDDDVCVGKADKIPPFDGQPPSGKQSSTRSAQGEKRPGAPAVPAAKT